MMLKTPFLPQFVKLRAFESMAYVARISAIPVEEVECRPYPNGGKAEALREETGKSTAGTAGVEI
jgi:hypothetical protein